MMKRIFVLFLTVLLIFGSSVTVFACDEEQSNFYVLQILFGDDYSYYEKDSNTEKLLSAMYICSEQSNKDGEKHLDSLKKARVSGVPTLEEINVKDDELFECSHKSWEYVSEELEKQQEERKALLRKTAIKVFKFGWFAETFQRNSGKIDSFAALLYYTHILADYLADDPMDTAFSANGYDIPAYSGNPVYELNGNRPSFTSKQKQDNSPYYEFSSLDSYGRAGVAFVNVGPETLAPANSRQQIGNIKPSGWAQQKYAGVVNSEPPYLYNRCHLIAHQLANNDAENNLITGTRYLNVAMIPYEDEVADYVKETGNHVLYRATPVYTGDNAVASGVQLEAYSVEDRGQGICFNVYLYNVQPGIDIDYANGSNELEDKTLNEANIIPFAISGVCEDNPDLMYEIQKNLEVLFSEQAESDAYELMMRELDEIADKARKIGDGETWREYAELKQYEYEYVKILIEYVPELLAKESFFKSVYKGVS